MPAISLKMEAKTKPCTRSTWTNTTKMWTPRRIHAAVIRVVNAARAVGSPAASSPNSLSPTPEPQNKKNDWLQGRTGLSCCIGYERWTFCSSTKVQGEHLPVLWVRSTFCKPIWRPTGLPLGSRFSCQIELVAISKKLLSLPMDPYFFIVMI